MPLLRRYVDCRPSRRTNSHGALSVYFIFVSIILSDAFAHVWAPGRIECLRPRCQQIPTIIIYLEASASHRRTERHQTLEFERLIYWLSIRIQIYTYLLLSIIGRFHNSAYNNHFYLLWLFSRKMLFRFAFSFAIRFAHHLRRVLCHFPRYLFMVIHSNSPLGGGEIGT